MIKDKINHENWGELEELLVMKLEVEISKQEDLGTKRRLQSTLRTLGKYMQKTLGDVEDGTYINSISSLTAAICMMISTATGREKLDQLIDNPGGMFEEGDGISKVMSALVDLVNDIVERPNGKTTDLEYGINIFLPALKYWFNKYLPGLPLDYLEPDMIKKQANINLLQPGYKIF